MRVGKFAKEWRSRDSSDTLLAPVGSIVADSHAGAAALGAVWVDFARFDALVAEGFVIVDIGHVSVPHRDAKLEKRQKDDEKMVETETEDHLDALVTSEEASLDV